MRWQTSKESHLIYSGVCKKVAKYKMGYKVCYEPGRLDQIILLFTGPMLRTSKLSRELEQYVLFSPISGYIVLTSQIFSSCSGAPEVPANTGWPWIISTKIQPALLQETQGINSCTYIIYTIWIWGGQGRGNNCWNGNIEILFCKFINPDLSCKSYMFGSSCLKSTSLMCRYCLHSFHPVCVCIGSKAGRGVSEYM